MDTDRCAVLNFAKEAHEAIFREFASCEKELAWLVQRKGTRRKGPVVDVHDFRRAAHLRNLFGILADHYSGKKEAKSGRVVEALVELLNHVRNNLFMALKTQAMSMT